MAVRAGLGKSRPQRRAAAKIWRPGLGDATRPLKKLDKQKSLYYNIQRAADGNGSDAFTFSSIRTMTHHHHSGHVHPPAAVTPSFLRMSVAERLVIAAVVVALLWGAAFWAMS